MLAYVRFRFQAVRPDSEFKSSPNFSKIYPKICQSRLKILDTQNCHSLLFQICESSPNLVTLSSSVTRWLVYSFNILPFTTINFCPIAHKICPSRFTISPNTEQTFKKLPKINNILKKWRNFAKSGHTEQQQQLPFNKWPSKFSAFICFILAYLQPSSSLEERSRCRKRTLFCRYFSVRFILQ